MADFIKDTLEKLPGVDPRLGQRASAFSGMNQGLSITMIYISYCPALSVPHTSRPSCSCCQNCRSCSGKRLDRRLGVLVSEKTFTTAIGLYLFKSHVHLEARATSAKCCQQTVMPSISVACPRRLIPSSSRSSRLSIDRSLRSASSILVDRPRLAIFK